jgi:hypothetical protein
VSAAIAEMLQRKCVYPFDVEDTTLSKNVKYSLLHGVTWLCLSRNMMFLNMDLKTSLLKTTSCKCICICFMCTRRTILTATTCPRFRYKNYIILKIACKIVLLISLLLHLAQLPPVSHGLLIHDVSRSHTTHHNR